ncbi:MAG: DNA polymerase III subunit alpha [Bacteroidales bacterium]
MYLNCHSYYSLRYGTMTIEELVGEAKKNGIHALVLTDINNTMGMMDFIKECNENDIQPIAGVEFRSNNDLLYIGIAKNNKGFAELNEFLTHHNLNKLKLPEIVPDFNYVYIIYPWNRNNTKKLAENEYFGIKPVQIPSLITSGDRFKQEKLVVWHPVTLKSKNDFEVHQCLRAVDNNTLISKLTSLQMARPNEVFIPTDKLLAYYSKYPQIIRNTENVLGNCSIGFDFKAHKNKKTFTGDRTDDKLLLEKLAYDGLKYRYGDKNKLALERVQHELEVIDNLGFSAYFLITWDIIRYSQSRGIYHVGRGSGANSIVSYCLQITDVDPIELDLYFERFINPKRTSPPDFDIDYSWKDRDEIQDYIFKRHGQKHTALLGATSTFKDRAIIRELGKVYGLPKEEIDILSDNPHKIAADDVIAQKIMNIGHSIMDFPNTRSIHAGGILISDQPITNYVALDMPPKGFPTTQWDMYVAEMINFEKLDILSQRGIGHIKECVDIVLENKHEKIDVHRVRDFKKDVNVNKKLHDGDAIGCFYIESPAMRGLLKKLQCNDYIRLVAASSIIRPGVAKSGMMKEYIKRFHNPDGFKYLHPIFEQQLKETFGVMVYQEDVIKIAHHFAGLDLSDADILRRAMSGKHRSKQEFERIRSTFFNNCKQRGYSAELADEVWRQIASFAGYAFSKAHSASYAVESYQSLYLKTYYPLEFMVAVINNFGGFYHTWVYVNEAKQLGGNILLPCVNNSNYVTRITGPDIYLGFVHIKSLEEKLSKQIINERNARGVYKNFYDFLNRIIIGIEQLKTLIRVGAMRFTNKSKQQLLWEAHWYFSKDVKLTKVNALFDEPVKDFHLPELTHSKLEDAYDEIELLGFPVSFTRFDLLKTSFRSQIFASDLTNYIGKKVRMLGDLVTIKYVHTVKKEWMHFGCFLDENGKFFDTVHFPDTVKKYPFTGYGVYLILGKVLQEFGFPSIEVEKIARLPFQDDLRFADKKTIIQQHLKDIKKAPSY